MVRHEHGSINPCHMSHSLPTSQHPLSAAPRKHACNQTLVGVPNFDPNESSRFSMVLHMRGREPTYYYEVIYGGPLGHAIRYVLPWGSTRPFCLSSWVHTIINVAIGLVPSMLSKFGHNLEAFLGPEGAQIIISTWYILQLCLKKSDHPYLKRGPGFGCFGPTN